MGERPVWLPLEGREGGASIIFAAYLSQKWFLRTNGCPCWWWLQTSLVSRLPSAAFCCVFVSTSGLQESTDPDRLCSFAAISYRFSRDPAMTFRKGTVELWNGILNALLWILNMCNESEPRESKPYLRSNFISLWVVKRAVPPASL